MMKNIMKNFGMFVLRLLLAIVFFTFMTIFGFISRMIKKGFKKLNKKNAKSYWIVKE
jgi:polyferredoxin